MKTLTELQNDNSPHFAAMLSIHTKHRIPHISAVTSVVLFVPPSHKLMEMRSILNLHNYSTNGHDALTTKAPTKAR
jgi:hypothetical protein